MQLLVISNSKNKDISMMNTSASPHTDLSSSESEAIEQNVFPKDQVEDAEGSLKNQKPEDSNSAAPDDILKATKLDEEGLSLEYDVVVCGTGLVQSILASALARAGKSVLHCDGADHYGELDAVWSLPMVEEFLESKDDENNFCCIGSDFNDNIDVYDYIPLSANGGRTSMRWHNSFCSSSVSSRSGKCNFGISVGTNVQTPYGDGMVCSIRRLSKNNDGLQSGPPSSSTISLEIEMKKWKLADGRSPIIYVNLDSSELLDAEENRNTDGEEEKCIVDATILEDVLFRTRNIRSVKSVKAETILKQSARSLALDATPSFVLATGRAVQGMLASGVADYLEFKTVDGLYWLENTKHTGNKASNNRISKSNQLSSEKKEDDSFVLSRVPCSKNDVFGTKLLAPMEKRRFMKFIQLSMDYATKLSVTEDIRKEVIDSESHEESELESEEDVHSLNERHLNQGRSLARPQNKAVDTGELKILQEIIENESMTFDEFLSQKYKLSPKLRSIVRYALAWEIDDSSTTLAKGMTTLRKHLQALGRYGTTAFLTPLYGSGELSQAFCRSAAVFGATYLLRRAPLAIKFATDTSFGTKESTKYVKGIVLSRDIHVNENRGEGLPLMKQQQPNSQTKVVKCSNVIVPVNAMDPKYFPCRRRIIRRIGVFSGNVIQSNGEDERQVIFIPPRTTGNVYAIHGVLLDSSVSIAPQGCTVLHLTTTIKEEVFGDKNSEGNVDAAEILEHAQLAILKSRLSDDLPIEMFHITFSHKCPDIEAGSSTCYPNGIHPCSHIAQALTADAAFEQAENIFSCICPGDEFLGLSSGIDKVIRDRAEEKKYEDDEKNMLESALGMIGHTPSSSPM